MQWRVLLVAQRANRTRTIAVVPEINTLILLADINLFSDCNISTVQLTSQFKNDKMKHNTVKATGQTGRHWSNITPRSVWPMSHNRSISYDQKYLKKVFYA